MAEIYGKLDKAKNSGGLIETDYMILKRRLARNKDMTNEFKANGRCHCQLIKEYSNFIEKQIVVRAENLVLLNKLRDISNGKQVSYLYEYLK